MDLRRIKYFFENNLNGVIQSKINPDVDLSEAILKIALYNDKLIGIKASDRLLGDWTNLFPIEITKRNMSTEPTKTSQSSFNLSHYFSPSFSGLQEREINPSSSQPKNPIIDEDVSKPLESSSENADSFILDQNRKDMSMQIKKVSQSPSNPSCPSSWSWSNWWGFKK